MDKKIKGILATYKDLWSKIFSMCAEDLDFTKPLTPKILSNPNHPFVKQLVYIYSMESFVYKEMNLASRSKDKSKIKFYGAFASALSFIIHCGNDMRTKSDKALTVFRGFPTSREDFE